MLAVLSRVPPLLPLLLLLRPLRLLLLFLLLFFLPPGLVCLYERRLIIALHLLDLLKMALALYPPALPLSAGVVHHPEKRGRQGGKHNGSRDSDDDSCCGDGDSQYWLVHFLLEQTLYGVFGRNGEVAVCA